MGKDATSWVLCSPCFQKGNYGSLISNDLISTECVNENEYDGSEDGASVYLKNSGRALKGSRTGVFLSGCVVQKISTGTKASWIQMTSASCYSRADGVIEYFRGRVSRPLYAVVAVGLLCGRLPLDRVPHAIWVEENRKAWFSLQSA